MSGAAATFEYEPKTAKQHVTVAQSFEDFCAAMDIETDFSDVGIIKAWMADYVRQGYRAKTLSKRLGSLRTICRGRRARDPDDPRLQYPRVDSDADGAVGLSGAPSRQCPAQWACAT